MTNYKPVHIGVVGAGAISDLYLKNMTTRYSLLQVDAICSKRMESARKKAEQYGIRACTLEEMMVDPEIEMIVNLTPAHTHYSVIKQALLAGKHVYTEKVLTDNPETAAELVALADEKGLYLGSAPDTFMGAGLQLARQIIDSGEIGEVTSFAIASNRDNNFLLSLFAFLREPGGGLCYDYAVYYLTALVSLLGPVDETSAVVRAPYQTHVNMLPDHPDYGKVMQTPNESQVYAIIRMESGVTGTLHINADSVFFDQSFFAIYGTKGILYIQNPDWFTASVKVLKNGYEWDNQPKPEIIESPFAFGTESRGIGAFDMALAIRSGRAPRASKELAYHVMDVLSCFMESSEKKCFCKVASTCERPAALTVPTEGEESSL